MDVPRILFVCIGNICRSPVAEACARAALGPAALVGSAGTDAIPGSHATPEAIATAEELGMDLRGHRARAVGDVDLDAYDRIVALTPAIARDLERRFGVRGDRIRVLDIADPYGRSLEEYRVCASRITTAVRQLLALPR